MSGEWRNLTLGELTTWASGGTPSKSKQEYWNGDIPWISASSMKTRFLCDSHLKITRAGLDNGSRTADTNEILLLVRGSELHKRIPVGIAVRPVAFNQDVKAIKVGDEILPVFLYYWLLANEGLLLAKVEQTGIGAGKLDTGVLKKLIVPVPPLHEQRRIAKILGDLDDKIELNRKMNETLEQMARALFKSWFVDFDPVRAKMEGRQPTGMDAATAALFPDRLVDSELGPIPEGWEVKALGEVAVLDKGLSYKGDGLASEGGMPMVNLGCFTGRGLFSTERIKRYTGEYRERHLVHTGDLVLANTDMTQNRVIIGSPALIPELDGEKTFLFTHHVFAVRFKADLEIWRRYVFFTLLKPEFREIAEGFSTGTTVLALPRDGLTNYLLCLPPSSLLRKFERQVGPMLAAVDAHNHQSATLSTLRDALLPKLVSGEVSPNYETP